MLKKEKIIKNFSVRFRLKIIKPEFLLSVFLILSLLVHVSAASIQYEWTDIEKIVAVGDIHGDYNNFLKILKGTRIIDENLQWIGGNLHLVQTGDIMDRGPEAKKALDLLIKLEKEAKKAGGFVHALIGNHEEMNFTGTVRFDAYVPVEQFLSFLPKKYKEKKEKLFKKQKERTAQDPADLKDYWEEIKKNDKEARSLYTENFRRIYGKWLLKRNIVIKINDIIFVHGGISEEFSTWNLEHLNNTYRKELEYPQKPFKILVNRSGPLWYRDLALAKEEEFKPIVDRILSNLNAIHMVMGHTVQINKIVSRFDGRIWLIDSGISDLYGGNLKALIIEKGNFSVWCKNNQEKFLLVDSYSIPFSYSIDRKSDLR